MSDMRVERGGREKQGSAAVRSGLTAHCQPTVWSQNEVIKYALLQEVGGKCYLAIILLNAIIASMYVFGDS